MFRFGVRTRFLAPTNHRGARIKVLTNGGHSRTYPYEYSASDSHAWAVRRFLADDAQDGAASYFRPWDVWRLMDTEDGRGYIYVVSRE